MDIKQLGHTIRTEFTQEAMARLPPEVMMRTALDCLECARAFAQLATQIRVAADLGARIESSIKTQFGLQRQPGESIYALLGRCAGATPEQVQEFLSLIKAGVGVADAEKLVREKVATERPN